jgi:beta-1,2-rhamnosyltransferase WsaF-like protein
MARFAWFVPSLIEGSGGHRTIFAAIAALRTYGHTCDVYVHLGEVPKRQRTPHRLRALIREYYRCEPEPDRVIAGYVCDGDYDVAVATVWWSAPFASRLKASHKLYFVQDLEEAFAPVGDASILAQQTYELGLSAITIGRFLRRKLRERHGVSAWHIELTADETVYRARASGEREIAACFLHQPEKPRRCALIGTKALARLKRRLPEAKIYTFGSPRRPNFDFTFEHLGLLSPEECNRLYSRCSVGLCISATNPSRIPFEMMASGLPVVDVHGPNTIHDFPPEAVLLARPEPNAVGDALHEVLTNPGRARTMSAAGIRFMKSRPKGLEAAQFVAAVNACLAGRTAEESRLEPLYREGPYVSTDGPDLVFDYVLAGADPERRGLQPNSAAIAGRPVAPSAGFAAAMKRWILQRG